MLREESKHDRGHRVQWASTSRATVHLDDAHSFKTAMQRVDRRLTTSSSTSRRRA